MEVQQIRMFVTTAILLLILLVGSYAHAREALDRKNAVRIVSVCLWQANIAKQVQIGRQENIGHSELVQYQYVRNMLIRNHLATWAVSKIMEIFDMVFANYGEKVNHRNIFSGVYDDCIDEQKMLL